jgi:hypothetical protein
MWVLILEALLAGCLFVFIIWWTMFAGRRQGEPQGRLPPREEDSGSPPTHHDKPR